MCAVKNPDVLWEFQVCCYKFECALLRIPRCALWSNVLLLNGLTPSRDLNVLSEIRILTSEFEYCWPEIERAGQIQMCWPNSEKMCCQRCAIRDFRYCYPEIEYCYVEIQIAFGPGNQMA
jgi:hypothetical protein